MFYFAVEAETTIVETAGVLLTGLILALDAVAVAAATTTRLERANDKKFGIHEVHSRDWRVLEMTTPLQQSKHLTLPQHSGKVVKPPVPSQFKHRLNECSLTTPVLKQRPQKSRSR
jgi:hypothetical protein